MEEKVLIKSEQYDILKVTKVMAIIGVILSIIIFLGSISEHMRSYDKKYETYLEHQEDGYCYIFDSDTCWECEDIMENPTKLGYAIANTFEYNYYFIFPAPIIALIGVLIYSWLRSYELIITDKRIYGKVAWGKRVDLPVDSVSATATIRGIKGVSVSTSSGRISFLAIKNSDKIYKVMNNLLIERQQEKANATPVASAPQVDTADQLKKYKDLLDSGVITQEEFDAKKKQLLGL